MLVYIRAHERPYYLQTCSKEDIPISLLERFKKDKVTLDNLRKGMPGPEDGIERLSLEHELELKKADVKLITEDLISQHGDYDLISAGLHLPIKVQKLLRPLLIGSQGRKDLPLDELKGEIEKATGIPFARQRLWPWCRRQNKTCRPEKNAYTEKQLRQNLSWILESSFQSTIFVEHVPNDQVRLFPTCV